MFLILVTIAGPALAGPANVQEIYPGYTWHEVQAGIYVHARNDPLAGPVDGNSVVIVTDRDVLVIDTHIDPAAARAVIGRIREVTDRPVTHVVNTHWHDDHANGNHAYRQAFPEARFIAHRATLASMEEEWASMEDSRREGYERVRGRDILAAADQIENDDPQRAVELRVFAGYRDALDPELPTLELVYPDSVFDDRLVFERRTRTVELRWMGRGNSEGDVVAWLPAERVVITGDLLVAPVPFAFDSPMVEWTSTLGRVADLGAETIIPGHGAVQRDHTYLRQVMSLLEETVAAVRNARTAGATYESLPEVVDLGEQERLFAGTDPILRYAWRSYYFEPGVKSAWASLGYPVPDAP